MSTGTKTVSVALTTYNGSAYLREQLDSIYSQDYPLHEVFAVDDGSTDGTRAILEEYGARNGLLWYLNESKLGFIKNFERALSLCTGDYIALADQDDVWKAHKVSLLVREMDKGYSLAASDAEVTDATGAVIAPSLRKMYRAPLPVGNAQFKTLVYTNFVTGCTALITRELRDFAAPFPPACRVHDWWLAVAATRLRGIAYMKTPLVRYRLHGKNTLGMPDARLPEILFGALSRKRRRERRVAVQADYRRIQAYIGRKMFLTEEEETYLYEALAFYHDLLHRAYPLKTLLRFFARRNTIYQGANWFDRMLVPGRYLLTGRFFL